MLEFGPLVISASAVAITISLLRMRRHEPLRQPSPIGIVIHGGAWAIPDGDIHDRSVLGVRRAAAVGYAVLAKGGSSLDAVEAAVRVLEDDDAFDAGTGSVLNADGIIEMDAMLMDGKSLEIGSVAAVNNIKNAVSLARMVLERTDHCMLVGGGAMKFAEAQGVTQVPTESLVTADALEYHERFKKYKSATNTLFNDSKQSVHDTVGAVALDAMGHVAAGTSTGGIPAKMVGRVGDSPLVGCGAYADDTMGAVSTTGHGESIMKVMLAHAALANLTADAVGGADANQSLASSSATRAAHKALKYMRARTGGCGGLVMIAAPHAKGGRPRMAAGFSTEKMPWVSPCDDSNY
jgi:beta-aspartyl-peptidase (threonine type)